MELTGKVIELNPVEPGNTGARDWEKQEFVIETIDKYPVPVVFYLWDKNIYKVKFKIGDKINVSFDIKSRKEKGRWYTNLNAWKIRITDTNNTLSIPSKPLPYPETIRDSKPEPLQNIKYDELDLPF